MSSLSVSIYFLILALFYSMREHPRAEFMFLSIVFTLFKEMMVNKD